MNKGKENKTAEISERIAKILQYTGDTRNGFAIKLGYERAQTIYDIMNMKSAPSYDFFRRFSISEYSDIIDLKWLLSGEGDMLRNNEESIRGVTSDATNIPSAEETIIYKMYKDEKEEKERLMKEKDLKIDQLQSELRQQSAELAALKALRHSQNKEYQKFGGVVDTFASEPSTDYGGDFSGMNPPADSKKSSAGKMHK